MILLWVCLALGALLLLSPLGFAPIPWPDASAFFLPGWDWIRDPLHYQMRSQAAFIPSYLEANFNTMPALPLLLGLISLVPWPVGDTWVVRAVSLVALYGFSLSLLRFLAPELLEKSSARRLAWGSIAIALLVFLHPMLRWGTLVVRPEMWIGWFWILILIELKRDKPRGKWIGGWLALSAYFHFEAIALVIPTAAAFLTHPTLPTLGERIRSLFRIATSCTIFLSPWIAYWIANWSSFWQQMDLQFLRVLTLAHPVQDLHSLFHSLTPSLGHPTGWPKLITPYKGLLWLSLFFVLALPFMVPSQRRSLALGHSLVCAITFSMWWKKPEVWFLTLFHSCLIAGIVSAAVWVSRPLLRRALQGVLTLLVALGVALAWVELKQIPSSYSQAEFNRWANCVRDEVLSEREVLPKSLWQPHTPDLLTELRRALPKTEFTRSFDFGSERDRVEAWARTQDLILFTTSRPAGLNPYRGEARAEDMARLSDEMSVAFGSLGSKLAGEIESKPRVCVTEAFWALILRLR